MSGSSRRSVLAVALASTGVLACTPLDVAQRVAASGDLEPRLVPNEHFSLQAWFRTARDEASTSLNVYIEGDGRAWRTVVQPSADPTPGDPIGLRLAAADASTGAVLYVARPCQYGGRRDRACHVSAWTDGRFAERAVLAADTVIDRFVAESGADSVRLVGYSGGGVVAALVASRRTDVTALVTIAAPLDHEAWTRHHGLTPLGTSLNPVAFADRLSRVEQMHYVGADDAIVPERIVDAYLGRLAEGARADKRRLAGFGHVCCWVKHWPELGAGTVW